MISIILWAGLICAPPKGMTDVPYEERVFLANIHEGCMRRFGSHSCARRVTRVGFMNYHVICGHINGAQFGTE